jgi:AraC-like DNA-binding protein
VTGNGNRRDFWLGAADQYVRDCRSAATSLRASELAQRMKVTPARLTREFREAVGVDVSAYLRRQQIENAKQLLQEGARPEMIAAAAGFGTVRTFYRAFRRLTGITPAEYLRR